MLESLVNRHLGDAFPWGTFVVNASGSFALGLLAGLFAHRLGVPLWLQAGATVGFLGAYTTFSALSLQVYRSTATGHAALALANGVGSLVAGSLAVYAGHPAGASALGTRLEMKHGSRGLSGDEF